MKGSKKAGAVALAVAPIVNNDVEALASFASNPDALRNADKPVKAVAVGTAERVIFGIFGDTSIDRADRKDTIAGGVLAGKAISTVLRGVYGSDGVQPGVLTTDQIASTFSMSSITIKGNKGTGIQFASAALAKMVADRKKALTDQADDRRELLRVVDGNNVRAFSDEEINADLATAIGKLDSAATAAQSYIDNKLPHVADAMRVIRTAHNGTVKLADRSTLPVDVAFARVLQNIALKAVDVADNVQLRGN